MFRFKQFVIRQERCPMKVGTDGVLLGAWAGVRPSDVRMLDIGTGTGLIALMLAQRTEGICDSAAGEGELPGGVRVTGVDVEDVAQARENADASPWGGRVAFVQCPVQEFAPPQRFDLIVSNPPFFVDSLICPDAGRTTARHAVRLPFVELRDAVVRLLADGGRFAVILPTDEAARFIGVCRGHLLLIRRTDVRTTPRHPVKRVLMEFVRADGKAAEKGCAGTCAAASGGGVFAASGDGMSVAFGGGMSAVSGDGPECSELVIGTGEHEQYTPQYRALTRDFYLKF
ncbi:methyltransferase domain-containing protein [uncultured Alistipes sp.]|uniref:tRNA1(Val) (adenine(37)-N6)-methyltransferase n=1 Tax=uncultured Alistipes sp. TaxID=538949 RepID=UPI00260A294D|nr:methyltransferase domain-containing protein [uncultured Alistipes sp.]